jgi:hypothetical protein
MAAPRINNQNLKPSLGANKKFERSVEASMQKQFQQNKKELLRDFDEHPVTQELKGGVDSPNLSNTLAGQGSLYSFIGFPDGADPTSPVRELIEEAVRLGSPSRIGPVNLRYSISLPSEEKLMNVSRSPWLPGRSWLFAIEEGIQGLGRFIAVRVAASRSGGGIQTKNETSGATFRTVPYLTRIFNNFAEKFK